MSYFVLIPALLYLIALLWASIYWRGISSANLDSSQNKGAIVAEKCTMIIPFRNEEKRLPSLLEALKNCTGSEDAEWLFIDDFSDDSSVSLLERFKSENTKFDIKILRNQHAPGKKGAVKTAVESASNEIILCTDADCQPTENWIVTMLSAYKDSKIKFAFGPVMLEGSGFLADFQKAELVILNTIGGIQSNLGLRGMVNAANMSYRKETFLSVGAYESEREGPSGDDEFLLKKIHTKWPDSIFYVKSPEALVQSGVASTWKELVQQKIRWASKWKLHKEKLFPLTVLFFNIYFLLTPLLCLLFFYSPILCVSILFLKILGEQVLLSLIVIFYGKKINYLYFLAGFFSLSIICPIHECFELKRQICVERS